MDDTEKQDDLVEFGTASEVTKGMWPHGSLYDGGGGYYYCEPDACYPG